MILRNTDSKTFEILKIESRKSASGIKHILYYCKHTDLSNEILKLGFEISYILLNNIIMTTL